LQRLQPAPGMVANALGSVTPELAANLRMLWEAVNNGWNQWVLNYSQRKQLDLLKNIGFTSPGWEDLTLLVIGLVVSTALGGAAWTVWDRRQRDPWLRLLERVRRRLRRAGLELPAHATPREIATVVTQRFGPRGQPLSDWLLKLEIHRYARTPAPTLPTLRREYQRIPWPA
jgi:hypothetical protein